MALLDDTYLIVFFNIHSGKVVETAPYHSESSFDRHWNEHVDKYKSTCELYGYKYEDGDYVEVKHKESEGW